MTTSSAKNRHDNLFFYSDTKRYVRYDVCLSVYLFHKSRCYGENKRGDFLYEKCLQLNVLCIFNTLVM